MNQINQESNIEVKSDNSFPSKVSLETELSESLYETMKDFVLHNPTWDQYKLINSALATFLVQNGCTDSSVSEIYINQLFTPSKSF
ncbi:DUF2811 domain-containing protein [Prochlorococcus sp. AH-716-A09]|nr:DUF2811 domain-containing protein [Prochlorococcus sp. AH-716-A09]